MEGGEGGGGEGGLQAGHGQFRCCEVACVAVRLGLEMYGVRHIQRHEHEADHSGISMPSRLLLVSPWRRPGRG